MRFQLAFRNVFRNSRRSSLNILMLAGGVTAILLFRGFCDRILLDLREITIKSQSGHMQIATEIYWQKEDKRPKDALLPHYQELVQSIQKLPHVKAATGRLSFFGLLSKEDQSFSARGMSVDLNAEKEKIASFRLIDGTLPDPSQPFKLFLGSGLAKRLKVKAGDSLTVLGYTYDGVMNALDLEVGAILNTGISDFDDTTFLIPLSTAQKLLDTDKVEQIVVWLDETSATNEMVGTLNERLKTEASGVLLKDWRELNTYYQKCVAFFTTQNLVMEIIVLVLVLLGVLNTVGMSIFERTAEIGTLRALGDPERLILLQFVLEGACLGIIGAIVGIILGTGAAYLIESFRIPIEIPGASVPIKVGIRLLFSSYRDAILLVVFAAIIASFIPARKASKLNIVDALRRAI